MNQNEKDSHQSKAWLEGYWDGYFEGLPTKGHQNPYVELSPEWVDYETGYEEGWLDS